MPTHFYTIRYVGVFLSFPIFPLFNLGDLGDLGRRCSLLFWDQWVAWRFGK